MSWILVNHKLVSPYTLSSVVMLDNKELFPQSGVTVAYMQPDGRQTGRRHFSCLGRAEN